MYWFPHIVVQTNESNLNCKINYHSIIWIHLSSIPYMAIYWIGNIRSA